MSETSHQGKTTLYPKTDRVIVDTQMSVVEFGSRGRSETRKRVHASRDKETNIVGGPFSDLSQHVQSVGRRLSESPMGRAAVAAKDAAAKTASQAVKAAAAVGNAIGSAAWELFLGAAKVATSPAHLISNALTSLPPDGAAVHPV
jgi:hypothetical protein